MRSIAKLMQDWQFTGPDGKTTLVELPHTWNAKDGQDGGNDYWRGTCTYSTTFAAPAFDAASQEVWLQFEGVNSSAKVLLNGRNICTHDGGYSTFRVHISDLLGSDPDTVNRGIEQEAERAMLRRAVDRLSPREKKIMVLRFGLGASKEHTQKEVADQLGISQSYISRLEKRIIHRLRRDLEKAG